MGQIWVKSLLSHRMPGRAWVGIGIAVAAVGVATALRAVLFHVVGASLPFLTFFPAIIVAALYGGPASGLAATLLSAVAAIFWIEPLGSPAVFHYRDLIGPGLFVMVSLFIVWVCERARRGDLRAEEAVRAQVRLAAIVESSDDAIISKTLDGTIQSWNGGATRLFGYTAEEMIGRTIYVLLPQDRRAEEDSILERLRRGERVEHFETVRVRKDGRPVEVSVTVSPVLDADGRVVGASKIARDITDRRRAEADLRAAKDAADAGLAQWRAVIGSMTEGMVISDARGNLLEWNRAALEMFGFASIEQVRRPLSEFVPMFELQTGDGRIIAVEDWPLSRVLRGETFSNYELRVRRLDTGLDLIVGYNGTPVRDREGNMFLALLTVHDVSEQRRAELALRGSEARNAAVVNAAFDCIISMDHAGRVIEWNPAAERTFGYTRDEAMGTEMAQLIIPAALRDAHRAGLGKYLTTGEGAVIGRRLEMIALRKNGEEFPVELTITRTASDGPAIFTGFLRDITIRKRAEHEREQLLASERAAKDQAEQSSRIKDEFLATLSHELRTPLNAILGWSQVLKTGPASEEDLRQGLETIERNSRAQTQIIDDLLDMSRIISGKLRLDVQRLEMAPLIRAAVDTVMPAANAKGVRMHVVLDPAAGPVSGDPNRLQQVFWNLLANAIKFTPRGGRVQVLLERVDSHLEVSVIDTGEGIRAQFLPHVFDRFRQGDSSTTRRHGGLGLGLSIVKQLVELHGGSVRVKSAGVGQGATFTISMPLTVVHPEPSEETEHRHPLKAALPGVSPDTCAQIAGVKVLVVDDEPDARTLIRRVLEDCDAVVSTAESAAQGLELVQAQRPDVLVSDIGMPDEDGYALIRKVRALGPDKGGNVPAVALTAYARAEDRIRSVLAGYQLHVAKPVEPAELVTMVASLAGRTGRGF